MPFAMRESIVEALASAILEEYQKTHGATQETVALPSPLGHEPGPATKDELSPTSSVSRSAHVQSSTQGRT